MGVKVKLQNVRLDWARGLFEATAFKKDDPKATKKYGIRLLIPSSDTATLKMVQEAVNKVATEKWKDKARIALAGLENTNFLCLRKGAKIDREEYDGMMFIGASNRDRPIVIDQKKNPVTAEDGVFYNGCYVNTRLDIFAHTKDGVNMVLATLEVVQFSKDGDAFSGGDFDKNTDDFSDLSDQGDDEPLA